MDGLREDAREALQFSSNLAFFKNELGELTEQVFQTLQQAPRTEVCVCARARACVRSFLSR